MIPRDYITEWRAQEHYAAWERERRRKAPALRARRR